MQLARAKSSWLVEFYERHDPAAVAMNQAALLRLLLELAAAAVLEARGAEAREIRTTSPNRSGRCVWGSATTARQVLINRVESRVVTPWTRPSTVTVVVSNGTRARAPAKQKTAAALSSLSPREH
jgi:hypothetical protein